MADVATPAQAQALARRIAWQLSQFSGDEKLAFVVDLHSLSAALASRLDELRRDQAETATRLADAATRSRLHRAYGVAAPSRRS